MMADFAAVSLQESAPLRDRRLTRRKSAIERNLVGIDMGAAGSGMILDASPAGLGIQTRHQFQSGAIVDLNVLLPEDVRVSAAGVVAWSDHEGRVGIRLARVKNSNADRFKRWLNSLPDLMDTPRAATGSPVVYSEATRNAVHQIEQRIRTEHLALDASLKLIVQRLAALPGASGSAIALGSPDEMVCCQSTGLAPDLGVRINPNAGLTGECIRTHKIVQCEDTESDPRVNRAVCRVINMRSCAIVPVRTKGQVLGVLEVLAQRPRAFSAADVELLTALADLVEKLAFGEYRELHERNKSAAQAVPQQTYGKMAALDGILDGIDNPEPVPDAAEFETHETPPGGSEFDGLFLSMFGSSHEQPPLDFNNAALGLDHSDEPIGLMPAPSPATELLTIPVETEAAATDQPVVPSASSAQVSPAIRLAEPPVLPATVLQQEQGEDEPYISRALLLALAAILLALLAGILWGLFEGGGTPTSSIIDTPAPAVSHTPQTPRAIAETSGPVAAVHSNPPKSGAADLGRKNSAPAETIEAAPEAVPTISQVVQLPEVSPGASTPRFSAEAGPAQISAMTSISLDPGGIKPVLTGGQLVKRVNPKYPAEASGMSWQGEVVLSARITKSGKVEGIVRLNGNPILAEAAIQALKQWRYEPYRLDGQPIEVGTTITVAFTAPTSVSPTQKAGH